MGVNTWSKDSLEADHHHVLNCVVETITSIGVQMRGRKMKVRGLRECVDFFTARSRGVSITTSFSSNSLFL